MELSTFMSSIIPTADWYFTEAGNPRGYIQPGTLKELWFHTGTACNLACPFCLEGSAPGDTRLDRITLEDIRPYIDEALTLGVEQFSFTGGEPFVVKDIVRILEYAASRRPCLVLTNGTDALLNRASAISTLSTTAYPVSFRVSIDYVDREKHDQGRGEGNFDLALQGIQFLHEKGFKVSLARQSDQYENSASVDEAFRQLLKDKGITDEINIVSFPDFLTPNSHADVPEITEDCMTRYQTEDDRSAYMCAFSKMIVKEKGSMKILPCTLVDDDPRYGMTGTLKDSLRDKVILAHHRCYSCFSLGASCSETN